MLVGVFLPYTMRGLNIARDTLALKARVHHQCQHARHPAVSWSITTCIRKGESFIPHTHIAGYGPADYLSARSTFLLDRMLPPTDLSHLAIQDSYHRRSRKHAVCSLLYLLEATPSHPLSVRLPVAAPIEIHESPSFDGTVGRPTKQWLRLHLWVLQT